MTGPDTGTPNAYSTILTRKRGGPAPRVPRPPIRGERARDEDPEIRFHELSSYHAKAAYALRMNIMSLFDHAPLDNVAFSTLTFPEAVSAKEAAKRFRAFKDGWLSNHANDWVGIVERSARFRIHLHLLIVLRFDCRSGFDWQAYGRARDLARQGLYGPEHQNATAAYARSATPPLRALWAACRAAAPTYGMGRCEFVPIRTCGEAVSAYLAKYLTKHIGQRTETDRRAKTIIASRVARRTTTHIAWNSPGAKAWRAALKDVAHDLGCRRPEDLPMMYGPKWAHKLGEAIMARQDIMDPVA